MTTCQFDNNFWVGDGFTELKNYMRVGNHQCETIAGLLRERSALSTEYSKNLLKLANKVEVAGKDMLGSVKASWSEFKVQLESEARWHQETAKKFIENLADPLINFRKEQKKQRKPVEMKVDKSYAELLEARSLESKARAAAFQKVKAMEQCWEQHDNARLNKNGKTFTDKDIQKYEKAAKKAEEESAKKDKEYRAAVKKLEACRRSWEAVMLEGCREMQSIEEARVVYLKSMMHAFNETMSTIIQEHVTSCDRLQKTVNDIDEAYDVQKAAEIKGTGSTHPDEVLYDAYEEDPKNLMDSERRRTRLDERIREFEEELSAEEKTLSGVVSLRDVYNKQPNFSDEKGQQDVDLQIAEGRRKICSIKATLYKLQCSLCEATGSAKPDSEFKQFITFSQTGQDIIRTALFSVEAADRMYDVNVPARSGSVRRAPLQTPGSGRPPVVESNEEFSDDESSHNAGERARVLFDYDAVKDDELTIREGDELIVTEKYEDGWWKGLCNGVEGIFPESYVEIL